MMFHAVAVHTKRIQALARTAVVMLTSGSHPGDAARCRNAGITSYLNKPVSKSESLNIVGSALLGSQVAMPAPRPEVSPLSQNPSRILLVEDNPVNQRLALRLLEKRGHTVVSVSNGNEALAELQR
jgi:two-component system sensor histidine kinase/response regulator